MLDTHAQMDQLFPQLASKWAFYQNKRQKTLRHDEVGKLRHWLSFAEAAEQPSSLLEGFKGIWKTAEIRDIVLVYYTFKYLR